MYDSAINGLSQILSEVTDAVYALQLFRGLSAPTQLVEKINIARLLCECFFCLRGIFMGNDK